MYHIEEFLNHLKASGYAKSTIRYYSMILKEFTTFLCSQNLKDIRNVSKMDVTRYFKRLTPNNSGMVSAHQKTKMLRIRIYFEYLEKNQKIFISPMRDFVPPKSKKTSYPVLTAEMVLRMIESIKLVKPNFIKARAIMELMYSAALRTREVYNLKISDIDFQKGILFIYQSKNKKDRVVPVGKNALYWTVLYIKDIRPRYTKKYHDFVFINHKNGCQLTGYGLLKVVNKTLLANNFDPIKLYSLRVTAATTLLKNGMSITYISRLLGHSELNTTKLYLRVQQKQLENELIKKHPRYINASRIDSEGGKHAI